MKRGLITRIISMAFVLSALVPAAHAYDFQLGGVYYNVAGNNKSVSVTYSDLNDNAYSGDIVIPESVTYRMTTYPVKAIENLAFFNCGSLTSLKMPDTVTQIGDQAFSHCYALTSINFSSKLQRIGDYAFEFCEDLTEVNIPASVTQIGYAAFTYCRSVEGFNVDEANPMYVSVDGVIFSKTMKRLVQYPAAKTDADFAIPGTVTMLPDHAFSPQPYLNNLTIGESLTSVTSGTFAECYALKNIDVDDANQGLCSIDGVLYDKDVKVLIQYPVSKPDPEYDMPSTVTELLDLSMLGVMYLHDLTLPASLTTIGSFALYGCMGLGSVICHATVPPVTQVDPINTTGAIFSDEVYIQASLQVPEESVATYKSDREWGKFSVIYEIGGSGLDSVGAGDGSAPALIYDINGRRHDKIIRGLNIVNGRKLWHTR